HLGSFKGSEGAKKKRQYTLLIKRIQTILASSPKETAFIIENAGTRKIGRMLEEIAEIVEDVGDLPAHVRLARTGASPRVRVCLDTCHLHAAGYDLRGREKLDAFLKKFDKKIGLERLECFHANDSRDPFGSLRDRHENIGEGAVGKEVFASLLNHQKTKRAPFIIETPGFDDMGPDKKNLDILRSFVRV
ncbi:MAG: deoxyribonuclease IV, partial [Parcubacteria group bacterium Greene0416_79]